MKYRPFGRTGLQVSTLCLGTAFLGSFTPVEESIQIIQRAMELGVNFIDTANTYGDRRFNIPTRPRIAPWWKRSWGARWWGIATRWSWPPRWPSRWRKASTAAACRASSCWSRWRSA